jgi:ribosome recycling factor
MNEELQLILDEAEDHMKKAVAHLEDQLLRIRAGKASPSMLASVMVEYYGTMTPLAQVANVNTPDAKTIRIQPWEKAMLEPIEKGITYANLGLNPQNNGEVVLISVPPLTEERRRDLVKQAKAEGENAKVGVRSARKEANDEVKKLEKDGLSEDLAKDAEDSIQKLTDTYNNKIDAEVNRKEKDIMTI